MSEHVTIVEVGARDGLQNESSIVPAYIKQELIRRLGLTGLQVIEATSFVSQEWVPQLADAEEVMAAIKRRHGVRYPVLVPNMFGMRPRNRRVHGGFRRIQSAQYQLQHRRVVATFPASDRAGPGT